jgi:putative membrane protein
MFRGMQDGMGAGGWVLMIVFGTALLALIAWAIARIAPSRTDEVREPRRPADEPVEILDRRLARGEIDVETYEQLRSKLSSRPAAGMG